jgi:hypothetical protein
MGTMSGMWHRAAGYMFTAVSLPVLYEGGGSKFMRIVGWYESVRCHFLEYRILLHLLQLNTAQYFTLGRYQVRVWTCLTFFMVMQCFCSLSNSSVTKNQGLAKYDRHKAFRMTPSLLVSVSIFGFEVVQGRTFVRFYNRLDLGNGSRKFFSKCRQLPFPRSFGSWCVVWQIRGLHSH